MSAYTEHKAKLVASGYQGALKDLADKLDETKDPMLLLQWIMDNSNPSSTTHERVKVFVEDYEISTNLKQVSA